MKIEPLNLDHLVSAIYDAGGSTNGTDVGSNVKCPFHEDKTPSAGIYMAKEGTRYMFGCRVCDITLDAVGVLAKGRGVDPAVILKNGITDFKLVDKKAKVNTNKDKLIPNLSKLDESPDKVAVYKYNTISGKPVGVVYRLLKEGKKTYRQFKVVEGGYKVGMPKENCPLFQIEKTLDAEVVAFGEGEKSALALTYLGMSGVSAYGGSNNGEASDYSDLVDKEVVIFPDADAVGMKYALRVEELLGEAGAYPRIIEQEALFNKYGVDYSSGNDIADVVKAAHKAGKVKELKHDVEALVIGKSPNVVIKRYEKYLEDISEGVYDGLTNSFHYLEASSNYLSGAGITFLCGDAGAGKSFWSMELLIQLVEANHTVKMWFAEDDSNLHLRRGIGMMIHDIIYSQIATIKGNMEAYKEKIAKNKDIIDRVAECIYTNDVRTVDRLVEWMEDEASKGTQILMIDPITIFTSDGEEYKNAIKIMSMADILRKKYGTRFFFVTHPRSSKSAIHHDNLAGGRAFSRFTHNVLWLTRTNTIQLPEGDVTRIIHILKARDGKMTQGNRIGFDFDGETGRFIEVGTLKNIKIEGSEG